MCVSLGPTGTGLPVSQKPQRGPVLPISILVILLYFKVFEHSGCLPQPPQCCHHWPVPPDLILFCIMYLYLLFTFKAGPHSGAWAVHKFEIPLFQPWIKGMSLALS